MTGLETANLMSDKGLKGMLAKYARRYSSRVEDQEEYIQDAWIRIAEANGDMSNEYYAEQGRKAMNAARMRKQYAMQKKHDEILHGIGKRTTAIPSNAIDLGRGKYLVPSPEQLSSWYYPGEWEKYGLKESDGHVVSFHKIIVT